MSLPEITPQDRLRPVVDLDGLRPQAPPIPLRDDWREWSLSYALIRHHTDGLREVLALGLTFAQVTRHCRVSGTYGREWFDGFAMCTKEGDKCER